MKLKDMQDDRERLPLVAFRIRKAAEALDVSRAQLYKLIGRGYIKTFKIGSRGMRISRSELERYMQEKSEAARS